MYEPGVIIRPPRSGEEEKLGDLIFRFYRFNEEFDPAWSMIRNAREKAVEVARSYIEGEGKTLVAEIEGEIVGYTHAKTRTYPMLEASLQGVILELYVKPTSRGRGVATKLVEAISEELKKEGASVITAEFPAANVVARNFYTSRGFRAYTNIYLKEV